jgi:hypothetical protein
MKYKISVIVSGIRSDNWTNIYNDLYQQLGETFQLICCGPNFPPNSLASVINFIYIRDFGSPARCFQLASTVATGKYIFSLSDDCILEYGSLAECISIMDTKSEKDGMIMIYSEGQGYTGNQHTIPEYWTCDYHSGLHKKLVNRSWKIAPQFMYNLENYRRLGGLDCRWEHINMNTHDLAFRVQRDGGILHYAPRRVARFDWKPWDPVNKIPVQLAYELNDEPLFNKIYDGDIEPDLVIDYNNWTKANPFWERTFKFE